MVHPNKDKTFGLTKLRIRRDTPFYKPEFRCGVVTIFVVAIVWTTTNRSTSSSISTTSTGNSATTSSSSASLSVSKPSPRQDIGNNLPTATNLDQLFTTPECEKLSAHRWSNRFSSRNTSTVQSMFNCDLPNATCRYYFPVNFFEDGCGIGREFAHHITEAEAMRRDQTLWNNMPSVGFPTLTMDHTCINIDGKDTTKNRPSKGAILHRPVRGGKRGSTAEQGKQLSDLGEHTLLSVGQRCMTERISFIHVHKSGGTSLHRSFDHINRNKNATITRHKWFTPSRVSLSELRNRNDPTTIHDRKPDIKSSMYNFTLESTLQATTYPAVTFGEDDHVIFAVVRDPTERFISSIGQAMGGEGSQRNMIGKILQEECIKSTSALTLTCMAKYVRDHGFWIELHFTPQVIDISFTTIWQDIPIAVFPFVELKNIVAYLGTPNVRGRSGTAGGYRPDPVLSEMSVDDYDDESLRIVCEIYEADVIMQRSLGIEVTRCDPFIKRL